MTAAEVPATAESPTCDMVPHSMGGGLTWCRTHLRVGSECEPGSAAHRSWIPADAKHIEIRRLIEALQATVDENPDVRFVVFVDQDGYEYAPVDAGRIMPDHPDTTMPAHLEMGLFKP